MSSNNCASVLPTSCARSRIRRCGLSSARWKGALLITDARPTARPEVVEVTLAMNGRPLRLRRDQCEFWPGKVYVPLWLYEKVMEWASR